MILLTQHYLLNRIKTRKIIFEHKKPVYFITTTKTSISNRKSVMTIYYIQNNMNSNILQENNFIERVLIDLDPDVDCYCFIDVRFIIPLLSL